MMWSKVALFLLGLFGGAIDHDVYTTPFADLQLELWELDEDQWRKVLERVPRVRRARDQRGGLVEQLPL